LEHESDITVDDFESLGKNSPFVGWRVFGKTLATWVDGEIVYEDQTK
ncbi:MAG: dihydroorotase, partial [Leuconostoc falkenbergense]